MPLTSRVLRRLSGLLLALAAISAVSNLQLRGADKRIVLIAGRPSHPPGMHEFRAGCLLLAEGARVGSRHHRAGV